MHAGDHGGHPPTAHPFWQRTGSLTQKRQPLSGQSLSAAVQPAPLTVPALSAPAHVPCVDRPVEGPHPGRCAGAQSVAGNGFGNGVAVDPGLRELLAEVARGRVRPEDAAVQLGQLAVPAAAAAEPGNGAAPQPTGDYAAVDLSRCTAVTFYACRPSVSCWKRWCFSNMIPVGCLGAITYAGTLVTSADPPPGSSFAVGCG